MKCTYLFPENISQAINYTVTTILELESVKKCVCVCVCTREHKSTAEAFKTEMQNILNLSPKQVMEFVTSFIEKSTLWSVTERYLGTSLLSIWNRLGTTLAHVYTLSCGSPTGESGLLFWNGHSRLWIPHSATARLDRSLKYFLKSRILKTSKYAMGKVLCKWHETHYKLHSIEYSL